MREARAVRRERWRRRYWDAYLTLTARVDAVRARLSKRFRTSETARKATELRDMLRAADDPTTSSERLGQIAETAIRLLMPLHFWLPFRGIARRIVERIAAHPNASPELLLRIVNDHDYGFGYLDGIFSNPILPLLPLECPDFLSGLTPVAIRRILSRNDTPKPLLNLLTAHPDPWIALEARTHRNFAGDMPPDIDPWKELEPLLRPLVATVTDYYERAAHVELVEEGIASTWIYLPAWLEVVSRLIRVLGEACLLQRDLGSGKTVAWLLIPCCPPRSA
jgi:hypothetical protein